MVEFTQTTEEMLEGNSTGDREYDYFKLAKSGDSAFVIFDLGSDLNSVLAPLIHTTFGKRDEIPTTMNMICTKAVKGYEGSCPICDAVFQYREEEIERLEAAGKTGDDLKPKVAYMRSQKGYIPLYSLSNQKVMVWNASKTTIEGTLADKFDELEEGEKLSDFVYKVTRKGTGRETKYSIVKAKQSEIEGFNVENAQESLIENKIHMIDDHRKDEKTGAPVVLLTSEEMEAQATKIYTWLNGVEVPTTTNVKKKFHVTGVDINKDSEGEGKPKPVDEDF